ncbi:MAG TPA: DUF2330 domain-containing protein [Ktedonobacterales bacterium]
MARKQGKQGTRGGLGGVVAWCRRLAVPTALALGLVGMQAQAALACGGLVAPNGAIRLTRATTLVAFHGGIEHYMTSFTYEGDVSDLGWIVPLPAVPQNIQEGGAWTLQRLFRETHPTPAVDNAAGGVAAAPTNASAQVIEQTQVEALNITVLRGSGQAVIDWCAQNGFFVNDETQGHLRAYGNGTPIFMAVKYDASRAQARHQLQGDGSPVLITMPLAHPWVPLEVLALDGQQVNADLYFLTDMPLNTSEANAVIGQSAVGSELPGAPGFQVAFQEPMNASLYHDLSTDRNMGWVRSDGWLTYLSLDAPDTSVTYDLSVTSAGIFKLAPFGTAPMSIAATKPDFWSALPHLPLGTPEVVLVILALLAFAGVIAWIIRGTLRAEARDRRWNTRGAGTSVHPYDPTVTRR